MLYEVGFFLSCTVWMSPGRRMHTAFVGFQEVAPGLNYLRELPGRPTHFRHPPPHMNTRLDKALVDRGLCASRTAAKTAIDTGLVKVDGVTMRKSSAPIFGDAKVTLSAESEKISSGQGQARESRRVARNNPATTNSERSAIGPRVCIVGTGLTGSLTCFHLRRLMKENVRIDVKDMARGVGGRMSTTRRGTDNLKANTGAQYISYFSLEAGDALEAVCAHDDPTYECPMERVDKPVRRSTHFMLKPEEEYMHFLPLKGTNSLVKKFLYGGDPDNVDFESRLQRIAISDSEGQHLLPLFETGDMSKSSYDVVILAMPPKDILKFFSNTPKGHDIQSQADLHARTNRGRGTIIPAGYRQIALESDVVRRLRTPAYIGRYSLALWFHSKDFIDRLWAKWQNHEEPHAIIDAISPQRNVLVTQSTIDFWRSVTKSGRGSREKAKSALIAALENLAGSSMPRAKYMKLLNWRTSQVSRSLDGRTDVDIVTAEGGRLIFTGDWCVESSFEGCNLAAMKAAKAAKDVVA